MDIDLGQLTAIVNRSLREAVREHVRQVNVADITISDESAGSEAIFEADGFVVGQEVGGEMRDAPVREFGRHALQKLIINTAGFDNSASVLLSFTISEAVEGTPGTLTVTASIEA